MVKRVKTERPPSREMPDAHASELSNSTDQEPTSSEATAVNPDIPMEVDMADPDGTAAGGT